MNDVDIFLNGGLTDEQNAVLKVVRDIRMDIFNVERYAREIGQNDIFTKTYIDRLIGNMRISGASGLTMNTNISMFGAFAERYLARRKYLTELLSKRVGRPMGAINAVEKFDECNKWLVAHDERFRGESPHGGVFRSREADAQVGQPKTEKIRNRKLGWKV